MITFIAHLKVRPENGSVFEALMTQVRDQTRRHEPGVAYYNFGKSVDEARTYWTAYTDIGPDHGGYYIDAFRKSGDRWLIAHRKVRLDWSAPSSLYMSSLSNLRQR